MAAAGVTALAAGMAVAVGAPVAQAEPTTFNPFDANNGFSIVSQGNVSLGNGELEGSVAAFGTIQSTEGNYPIRHVSAGMPDYTVPTIDGEPVRILANEFVGTGGFDLSNAGAESGTAEAEAIAKLVDTSNISAESRGGGAQGDFVRLTNDSGGVLDLKALPWADYSASDYTTAQDSVAAYFPDLDEQVAQTNKCLASMYDSGLVNMVKVDKQENMVFPEGLVDDRPNVINYDDVAGRTIKSDRMGGYKPTAQAPLVIRVAPGTTEIGAINVEGWSAVAGQDQELSRFIMLDLSQVTGDVTINGLEMGAIWAPNANLHYSSEITTNGQWFSKNFTSTGGGELHHHTFQGRLPCGDPGDPGEPAGPKIGTSVAVDGSDEKVLPLTGGTVVDTVSYENLEAGQTYELKGELRVAPTGEATGITAEATFTPDSANGTTQVTFELTAEQAEQYAGQDLVVYEYLYLDGEKVAEHTDPNDEAQTFTVAEADPADPKIGTSVAVDGSDEKVLPLTGGTVVDTVSYKNLEAGTEYQLEGELRVAPTGEATGITAEKTFTPDSANGTTQVTFELTADQAEQYAGQDLVVYEYLYLDGEKVAEHTDPTDEAQTFTVAEADPADPWIGTSVAVDGSDDKVLPLTGGTVVDTVSYENLEAGTEYQLEGELRVAPSGEATGITAEKTFTPDSADGTTQVTFELTAEQAEQYAGQDLVVYEYLYLDGEKVAEHTDPTDEAQTFTVDDEDPAVPGDPWIGTTVRVDCGCDKVLPLTGGTVIDTVRYQNLEAGKTYELKGELRVAPTGEATGITAEKTFTPDSADGTTEVTFELTADQAEQYAGQDLVVYEYLYLDGELIAEHTDPTDEAQTFTVDEDDTPSGSVGSIDLGSVGVGSLGVGSLGVGSLALGSLGSSGGDSSTGSGGTGSGDSSIGSLPVGSIGTGSDTGSDIDVGSTIDLGSNNTSGSLGDVGSTGGGSVDLGSLGVGSLGVGSLALGSLGSSGGDSSGGSGGTGSGDTGSGDSSIGSLPVGSIGTGSDTGSGSNGSSGSSGSGGNGSSGSTGSGDLGSLGSLIPVGSTGSLAPALGSLALGSLGSLGSSGGDSSGGSGGTGSGDSSIGSLPVGSIGTGSDTGSGSNGSGSNGSSGSTGSGGNGSSGSTGSGDFGSLGSLIPVGSTGSLAPALGSLALPLGSLALAAGSAAAGESGDSGSANNGSTGSGTSDPNGGSGTQEAPTTGEQGTAESAGSGDGNAASGSGTTNSGAGASTPSAKGGRIDAGLGANIQSATPQIAAGLALLVIAGAVIYTAVRRRG